jgi:hypothetical protein
MGALISVLLAVALSACEPPPLTGITCLMQYDDGTIVAYEDRGHYVTADGGISWQVNAPIPSGGYGACPERRITRPPWTQADPANPNVVYEFNPDVSISRSDDGGLTWQREVDLSGTEARTAYYVTTRGDGEEYRSGPLDAVFDAKTGNLVVAMGYEGVLVRTPEARWGWVSVGKYSRVDMRNMSITLPLISRELWLAVLLGIIVAGSLPVLAGRKSLWLLLGAVIGSIVSVVGIVYLLMKAFEGTAYSLMKAVEGGAAFGIMSLDIVTYILLFMMIDAVLILPTFISWKTAVHTQQPDRRIFVWSGACWTYLIMTFAFYYYSAFMVIQSGGSREQPLILFLKVLFAIAVAAITRFILIGSHLPRRVRITSIGFGLLGALIVAACFLLWGIGGIPFRLMAAWWAAGLNVLSLGAGIAVVRRLARPGIAPSQRDVPPPDEPRPV